MSDTITLDPITAQPDMTGQHGKAWKVDLPEMVRRAGVSPEDDAALVIWIVEAPWAHPLWHSYAIVLLHLRPMKGDEPMIYLKGATHELWVDALDPDKPREPALKDGMCARLRPSNFAAQIIEATDDAAMKRVENAVRQIVDGKLSPDTDFGDVWSRLFGNNMLRDKS